MIIAIDPALLGLITAPIAAISALYNLITAIRRNRAEAALVKEFGSEFYSVETIRRATRFYVHPSCSSVDPAQEAEMRQVISAEEDLFSVVTRFINQEAPNRHLLLLADSGMGKSSFVLNYYQYYRKRRKRARKLAVVPLGMPNADEYIEKIADKRGTILFLDAFDEDVKAIDNHLSRLADLMNLCSGFSRVLITCRTQFFSRDQEIPVKTGIISFGPRELGSSGSLEFWKLYLAPFSDHQIGRYIGKRYPIWQLWNLGRRMRARQLVLQVPYLNVRPMLLAHIPDILESQAEVHYTFQLYKILVENWIKREEAWVEGDALREFSQRLAVDMYVNRVNRGAERIPRAELAVLAGEWGINLRDWQLGGRSLLNRDAAGNYKFAHRSIMEYLFAEQAVLGNLLCRGVQLTDQMRVFIWEMCDQKKMTKQELSFHLEGVDLRGLLPPLRSSPYYDDLSRWYLWSMTKRCWLFDSTYNRWSPGRMHLYVEEIHDNRKFISDLPSGLMWPTESLAIVSSISAAQVVIAKLNESGYGGYSDWRLPTLEEAMSLLVPEKNSSGLFLDPLFGALCERILTGDSYQNYPWVTSFLHGGCLAGSGDAVLHLVPVRSL